MKAKLIALAVIGLILICAIAAAQIANSNYRAQGGLNWVIGGTLTRSGTGYDLVSSRATVAMANPVFTFSVANKGFITLTTDTNCTGVCPTGGIVGQRIQIVSGAGANTMRVDDSASSMTIGGNITLTEGQSDVLVLECTDVDGDEWTCVFNHDN
jgi:hypothetical protein